tara:strand:+ start:1107 stop:1493 length:387 start_codon:yes stop_codon:yes gene_type:complete
MSKLLSFLGGNTIEKIGDVVDKLSTSDEERMEAKRMMKQILLDAEAKGQEQVTRRWEADMKSDNWLSKNIRPLICIFLTAMFIIISIFDGNLGEFVISPAYIPIYQTLLITVYGAYFAGRSIEKIRKK